MSPAIAARSPWSSLHYPRLVQRRTQALTDPLRRALFGRGRSVQQYASAEISSYFRVNGRPPADAAYAAMARERFASFVLHVGGLVEHPLHVSLAELRRWPKQTQITKHCCIQGWSAIASWGGVSLGEIMRRCGPLAAARYAVFYALDDKSTSEPDPGGPGCFYGTIDMALASDAQTILAYEMNESGVARAARCATPTAGGIATGLHDGQVHLPD